MSEWISVEDRLPEDGDKVLCCFVRDTGINKPDEVIVGDFYWHKLWVLNHVTHWMPLPSPPQTVKP